MKHMYTFMVTCPSKLAYKAVLRYQIELIVIIRQYQIGFNENVKS